MPPLKPDTPPHIDDLIETGLSLGCLRESFLWLLVVPTTNDRGSLLGVIGIWIGEIRNIILSVPSCCQQKNGSVT